jgi:uncharacterized protein YkwD
MMKHFNLLVLTITGLVLTGLVFPAARVAASARGSSSDQAAADIVEAVNFLRTANQVPPYQINPVLMTIAQTHSDYLAGLGVVTHFSASGARPFQRAVAAGYLVAGDLSAGGLFSENLLTGSNLSAEQVVDQWKEDPDHLNTMISPELRDAGVGVTLAGGVTYYVLDVGASQAPAENTPTVGPATLVATTTLGTPLTPVLLSTPLENGEIYHDVQPKEALWSIAIAYHTTVEEIKLLNGLATDEIFTGQKLLVYRPDTPTASPTVALSATFGIPTSTSTVPVAPTHTTTPTSVPVPPESIEGGGLAAAIIIVAALLAGAVGSWLGSKKQTGSDFPER